MKSILILLGAFAVVSSVFAVEHRFVCVDNGANRLVHVDQMRDAADWSVDFPVKIQEKLPNRGYKFYSMDYLLSDFS